MKLNKLLLQDRHKWTTNIPFGRKRRSTQVWTDPNLKYSGYWMLLYSWLIFWVLSSYSSLLQHKVSKTAFIFKRKGGRRILSDESFKRNRFSTDCGAINRMWVSISKTLDHITMVKVKLSHHGLQKVEAPRIFRQSAQEGENVVSHTYRPPLPTWKILGIHFC
jgi:hypothetical protein